MRSFSLLVILIVLASLAYSQENDNKHTDMHHHPKLELGISGGVVYNFTEKEAAPGIHIHFIKTLSKSDKLGVGFGYEAIFDDHRHNAASFIISYRPVDQFSLNFSPGIAWLSTENDSAKPSIHLEALYEWEFGNFHLGPLVGIAFNSEDLHASAGLHMAIGF